jgi:hypothetical protein
VGALPRIAPWSPARDLAPPGRRSGRATRAAAGHAAVPRPTGAARGLASPTREPPGPISSRRPALRQPRRSGAETLLSHSGPRGLRVVDLADLRRAGRASGAVDDLEIVAQRVVQSLGAGSASRCSASFGSWPARRGGSHAGARRCGRHLRRLRGLRCRGALLRGRRCAAERRRAACARSLNQPALFLNVLPCHDVPEGDLGELAEAWREMTYRTWGRMELKAPGRLGRAGPSLRGCARGCAAVPRRLWREGRWGRPGRGALARAGDAIGFATPRAPSASPRGVSRPRRRRDP